MQKELVATTYILKQEKTLLIYHPKFQKWLPPGGHVLPGELPHEAAKREALEETGYSITFFPPQHNINFQYPNACSLPPPFFTLLEEIPPIKEEPAHQHLDFVYVGTIKELKQKHAPQHPLRWFSKEEIQSLKEEELFPDSKEILYFLFSLEYLEDKEQALH